MPKCSLCDIEADEVCLPTLSRKRRPGIDRPFTPTDKIQAPERCDPVDPSVCSHDKPPNPWALPDYIPPVDGGSGGTWGKDCVA
jgi:hypothetical protein